MHQHWSSRYLFILATAGAAVGLGNIWKFPYMAGMNGGGAFMLIYLLSVLLLGLPLMIAEALIGRFGNSDPISSLEKIEVHCKRRHLKFFGWWGALGLCIVLSFYSVLAGWSLAYFYRSASGIFEHSSVHAIQETLKLFLNNPIEMTLWHTVFLVCTLYVSAHGVKAGLERTTKVLMPLLFLLLIFLVAHSYFFGDMPAAIDFLFSFKPEQITIDVILSAVGHSFFTLALGAGAIIAYGSYAPENTRLFSAISMIAILDTLVAILAGLAIFPMVFEYQLTPAEGPTLIFSILPITFSKMHGGSIIACLFFLFLFLAAWTSSINLAEPIMAIMNERYQQSRKKTALLLGVVTWSLGMVSVLSFNKWSMIQPIHGMTFFDILVQIPDKLILPIGGIAFAVIVGWLLPKDILQKQLPASDTLLFKTWHLLVRLFAPIAIAIILISAYL